MHRQICWVDRAEDGVKREVRVAIQRQEIKWQFKRSDEERWDYTSPPTKDDWDELLEKVFNRHQRRNATQADLEFVRRQHELATAGAGDQKSGARSQESE
jgi:hypothetical protein